MASATSSLSTFPSMWAQSTSLSLKLQVASAQTAELVTANALTPIPQPISCCSRFHGPLKPSPSSPLLHPAPFPESRLLRLHLVSPVSSTKNPGIADQLGSIEGADIWTSGTTPPPSIKVVLYMACPAFCVSLHSSRDPKSLVLTQGSAEAGRNPGGVANLLLKSGNQPDPRARLTTTTCNGSPRPQATPSPPPALKRIYLQSAVCIAFDWAAASPLRQNLLRGQLRAAKLRDSASLST